jgi:uncharacterized protein YjbI with pentapeptide repeats
VTSGRLHAGAFPLLVALALIVAGCGGGDRGPSANGSETKPRRGFEIGTSSTARVINGCRIEPNTSCPDADLGGVDLRDASLNAANLRGATLRRATLLRADLRRAILSGANLTLANLRNAKLGGSDLSGADLSGADLSGAVLSGANLSGATFDFTTCPNGFRATSPDTCE